MIKGYLVDDWENVTKSHTLVALPSKAPVNWTIDTYFHEEKGSRRLGSSEALLLEDFTKGLKVYFGKMIGKVLLYKLERGQYIQVCYGSSPSRQGTPSDMKTCHSCVSCGRQARTAGRTKDQETATASSTCVVCSVHFPLSPPLPLMFTNNYTNPNPTVSLPEYIAQTNMIAEDIAKIKEEVALFNQWMCRNYKRIFINAYEPPSAEYIDQATE